MSGKKFVLFIAAVSCLLCLPVYSQKSTPSEIRKPATQLELVEAEVSLKTRELELKMCELAADEAKIESEKLLLRLEEAVENGASKREIAHAKLTVKQAGIRVEMRKVSSDMIRLKITGSKARLELLRADLKPGADR